MHVGKLHNLVITFFQSNTEKRSETKMSLPVAKTYPSPISEKNYI